MGPRVSLEDMEKQKTFISSENRNLGFKPDAIYEICLKLGASTGPMGALLLRYHNLQEVGTALRQDRQSLLFCAEGGDKYVPLEGSQLLPDYTGAISLAAVIL